jgi:Putative auto-transporter adhesin, head GIN domain
MLSARLLLAAAVAGAALSGCALTHDGPRVSQVRHVAPFTRVDNADSVDLRLHAGREQRLRVRAGRDVIGNVRTEVRDGTLRITFHHHGLGPASVVIDAATPRLEAITADGSGDVSADGIRAGAFTVRSDGSSDITVAGHAGRLDLATDGSGDADAAGLAVRDARVSTQGSGDVDVAAARRLVVALDGSGDVRYHGAPAVTRRDDGSGEVRAAG